VRGGKETSDTGITLNIYSSAKVISAIMFCRKFRALSGDIGAVQNGARLQNRMRGGKQTRGTGTICFSCFRPSPKSALHFPSAAK